MNIVEQSVSAGGRAEFNLDEFLSRPLYAHLAHNSDQGPRESPVWFQRRFDDVFTGELGLEMVPITSDTVVVHDQSYQPTKWARAEASSRSGSQNLTQAEGVTS
jgi:hypothetical protein